VTLCCQTGAGLWPGRRLLVTAGLELLLLPQFQIRRIFLFEVRIKLPPMEKHVEPSANSRKASP